MELKVGERGRRPEMTGNLYGRILDISEVGRREKVDVLYGKIAIFSEADFLGVERMVSAGVC